jgi:hypothetical protein
MIEIELERVMRVQDQETSSVQASHARLFGSELVPELSFDRTLQGSFQRSFLHITPQLNSQHALQVTALSRSDGWN